MSDKQSRGEFLLDMIRDEVDQRLNPDEAECWYCGGEGETHDCIDGCCIDAESGCPDCSRPCQECRINKTIRLKAIREEVIKANDVEIAIAWLKDIGRWKEGITAEQVKAELVAWAAKLAAKPEVSA